MNGKGELPPRVVRTIGLITLTVLCFALISVSLFVFDDVVEQLLAIGGVVLFGSVWNVAQWQWYERKVRRAYEVSLEEFVWERGTMLQAETRRARQVEETKNAFVRTVSHQLRTPLAAIRWNLEDFLQHTHASLSRKEEDTLRRTTEAAKDINRTVQQMLTLMDIQEQRVVINPLPTDPEALVRTVFAAWRQSMDWAGITFRLDLPARSLKDVPMDREKMREALMILLENARDYTKQGGTVTLAVEARKNHVRFTVTDTGIGISAEDMNRVFEPFFRGKNAALMKPSGSGAGLTIVQHYVRTHGGKVTMARHGRKGTAVFIDLPLEAQKA